MTDLLVKLFDLPAAGPHQARKQDQGMEIRRALVPEQDIVLDWVAETFSSSAWRSECQTAFARQPVSCIVAIKDAEIAGFFCYEATMKGLMGPCGVGPEFRRQGIFTSLALAVASAMAGEGYAYAVIPSVSSEAEAALMNGLGAVKIPDSGKSLYDGMLRR